MGASGTSLTWVRVCCGRGAVGATADGCGEIVSGIDSSDCARDDLGPYRDCGFLFRVVCPPSRIGGPSQTATAAAAAMGGRGSAAGRGADAMTHGQEDSSAYLCLDLGVCPAGTVVSSASDRGSRVKADCGRHHGCAGRCPSVGPCCPSLAPASPPSPVHDLSHPPSACPCPPHHDDHHEAVAGALTWGSPSPSCPCPWSTPGPPSSEVTATHPSGPPRPCACHRCLLRLLLRRGLLAGLAACCPPWSPLHRGPLAAAATAVAVALILPAHPSRLPAALLRLCCLCLAPSSGCSSRPRCPAPCCLV
mmetsp:Transcript_37802/g.108041  ORF Transcript_37802/g.108041 Transcript_37802/m.108041 type:complete len:306 (-) Transcript_37802:506-1423(-)